MPSMDEIKRYSTTVCEQIRWKKVHPMIAQEIEDHLCDQRDFYLSEGEEEKTATCNAIREMGDAIKIGMELDKTHKPRPQWELILLTIILMLVGTVTRYFIARSEDATTSFELTDLIIAMIIFFVAYFMDFTFLGKHPLACYTIIMLLSITGLLLSRDLNGRAVFSFFFGYSFPMVYLSLIFPLAYALFVYAMRKQGIKGILFCGLGYLPYAIILLLVPSTTGFLIYTLSALITICLAISKGWFGIGAKQGLIIVLLPTILIGSAVLVWLMLQSYRLERIQFVLNPYSDPRGYQFVMIRDLMSGALFLGEGAVSQQFTGVLSSQWFRRDMLLTVLTNKFGWTVFWGIVLLFLIFSVIAFYKVSRQRSVLGLMVSLPILLVFIMQTILYVASNLGFGVLTTLSLPLLSDGTAALIINAGLIGFMLSVFRTGDALRDNLKVSAKHNPLIFYEDGKLIIRLK